MIAKIQDLADGLSEYKLMMKGASEILIQKCSKLLTKDGIVPLDIDEKNAFQVRNL